jgi:hypothetical protein
MNSAHLITQIEFANSRRDDLINHAARQRLIQSVNDTRSRTSLRHRLGTLLVRSGERLQTVGRARPADDLGASAGVLHLAR